ncbi:hypothetical protein PSQ90_07750 [Devosia rhodophyticola]|uniref:Phage tail protein n=1 Tax=Devosia rhodophyticola TaxID=3026423 RepID=A0ABY7Z1M7_9HYPH|nr:hypothetical protein [Devosia rhodophyticola]WDR07302.1 hypothetical protein PSQ90_07750 [Devosia rhodophyticola]
MPNFQVTAKTKIEIGDAIADQNTDFTTSDFSGVTWTEIGGTTDLGTFGDTAEVVKSGQIGRGRVLKLKGLVDGGAWVITCDLDVADAGQLALIAAAKTDDNYPFRLTFDDAPSGGTASTRTVVGLVIGIPETYGDANSPMKLVATVEVNSNTVRVAAAEA